MISNTKSALSSFWLLKKDEMKEFFERILASNDVEATMALGEALSEYSTRGRIWKWMEGRMTKDYSLMPIEVAKEARKRFRLPKAVEPALYYRARRIKKTICDRKRRRIKKAGVTLTDGNNK